MTTQPSCGCKTECYQENHPEQPKQRECRNVTQINWEEWRKGRGWLNDTERPDTPFEFPKDKDESSFFMTEQEWERIRYALRYYRNALEDTDLTTEFTDYARISDKLATKNWADFRLSRDRSTGLRSGTVAHPGPTTCCNERMIRPTQGARWRCYGCGRML